MTLYKSLVILMRLIVMCNIHTWLHSIHEVFIHVKKDMYNFNFYFYLFIVILIKFIIDFYFSLFLCSNNTQTIKDSHEKKWNV